MIVAGEFSTGATSVTFGGTSPVSRAFVDDNTITAVAPSGKASGTVVDVIVTTPGGTLTFTTADQCTYP
jgi:hypothetical protein